MTTKRRKMLTFKLREISAVDRPAQAHATADVIKSFAKAFPAIPFTKSFPVAADPGSVSTTNRIVTKTPTPTQEQTAMDPKDKQIADLTAALQKANTIAALTDAERSHLAALAGAEADAFLAKGAASRAADVEIAKAADPVVYTDADGSTYRKSDDPRMVASARRADAALVEIAKARTERDAAIYAKRAADDLSHLPGDVAAKVSLLKAIDTITDEAHKAAALALLKAADGAAAVAFEAPAGNGAAVDATAANEFDALVAKAMTDHKLAEPEATVHVMGTAVGKAAYSKAYATAH